MSDNNLEQVMQTIKNPESNVSNQNQINLLWAEVKNLFTSELSSLPNLSSKGSKK